jgi:hypothetical protein
MRSASFKRIAAVSVAGIALGDTLAASPNKQTISFLFTNYGHVDGLNFITHCSTSIYFAFQSDGHTVPADKIIIGHNKVHPAGDPFTITRVPPPTTTKTAATTTT